MGFKIDIPTAKDSFRKLAMNPPELPGPSAYFLTMYEYDMENPRYIRTAEGTFRILVNERFLCQLMLECAEEYLKIWIDACSKGDIGVYGAEIKRLPAGKEIPVDVFHVSSSSIRKPLFPIPDEARRRFEQLYADKTR